MNAPSAGIAAVSYVFPRERRTLNELAAEGLLQTSPEVLSRFGFDSVHVATDESPFDLALTATAKLIQREGVDPESVDVSAAWEQGVSALLGGLARNDKNGDES